MKSFREILHEAKDVRPSTKKFGFYQDNPMGDWLAHERSRAKSGKFGGSVTGGFHENFMIPTKMVFGLPGLSGENRKLSDPDVQQLMKQIEVNGIFNAVFLNVHSDGKVFINEGNRRTLIAKTLGDKHIPIEIRYFAGGELIPGKFHPDSLAKVGKKWNRPKQPKQPKRIPPKPIKKSPLEVVANKDKKTKRINKLTKDENDLLNLLMRGKAWK